MGLDAQQFLVDERPGVQRLAQEDRISRLEIMGEQLLTRPRFAGINGLLK